MMGKMSYEVISRSERFLDKKPYISVIVLDYVQHDYSHMAIRSVLQQSIESDEFEVIVLTDSNNPAFYETLCTSSLNYQVAYTGRIGIGRSILIGVKIARGEVVCLLDNDDEWRSDRLKIIADIFQKDSSLGFIKNEIKPISKAYGRRTSLSFYLRMNVPKRTSGRIYQLDDSTSRRIIGKSLTHNSSSMSIRRDIILNDNDRLHELSALPDSYLFFLATTTGTKVVFLDVPLTLYRPRDDSASSRNFIHSPSLPSIHRLQRLKHIEIFNGRINSNSPEFVRNLFFLFCITTELLLCIKERNKTRLSFSQILRAAKLSVKYRAHQILLSILFYYAQRLTALLSSPD